RTSLYVTSANGAPFFGGLLWQLWQRVTTRLLTLAGRHGAVVPPVPAVPVVGGGGGGVPPVPPAPAAPVVLVPPAPPVPVVGGGGVVVPPVPPVLVPQLLGKLALIQFCSVAICVVVARGPPSGMAPLCMAAS